MLLAKFGGFFRNINPQEMPFKQHMRAERSKTSIGRLQLIVIGLPCGSAGKESTCNAGDPGSIPGLGRSPGGGHGNPLQYPCLENPHGQRSLESYSSWGHKESDTTEWLSIEWIYFCHISDSETRAIASLLLHILNGRHHYSILAENGALMATVQVWGPKGSSR